MWDDTFKNRREKTIEQIRKELKKISPYILSDDKTNQGKGISGDELKKFEEEIISEINFSVAEENELWSPIVEYVNDYNIRYSHFPKLELGTGKFVKVENYLKSPNSLIFNSRNNINIISSKVDDVLVLDKKILKQTIVNQINNYELLKDSFLLRMYHASPEQRKVIDFATEENMNIKLLVEKKAETLDCWRDFKDKEIARGVEVVILGTKKYLRYLDNGIENLYSGLIKVVEIPEIKNSELDTISNFAPMNVDNAPGLIITTKGQSSPIYFKFWSKLIFEIDEINNSLKIHQIVKSVTTKIGDESVEGALWKDRVFSIYDSNKKNISKNVKDIGDVFALTQKIQ